MPSACCTAQACWVPSSCRWLRSQRRRRRRRWRRRRGFPAEKPGWWLLSFGSSALDSSSSQAAPCLTPWLQALSRWVYTMSNWDKVDIKAVLGMEMLNLSIWYLRSSLRCPWAVPCSYAPYRSPRLSPEGMWSRNCIKDLQKPLLVSSDFRHCLMYWEQGEEGWKDTLTSTELQYHIFAGNGAHSSPQGPCYHLPVCVLRFAVCSLTRDVLIMLEQEASPAAFERSQTGAQCQKQEVPRENGGFCS